MIVVQPFIVNYFSENTYILHDDTKEAVIIDCGCINEAEENMIVRYIEENDLKLKHSLCTHLHLDHIFGIDFIYKTYGLRPEAHKTEVEGLPSPDEQAGLFGLPMKINFPHVEKYIVGGEKISFGHSELIALLVPGHSPGSLAFYNQKNGYLFSGDAIFAGSIGRTDLWGGNMEILLAAIHDKILSLPDDTIIYPGHGTETTVYAEKMSNPFLK